MSIHTTNEIPLPFFEDDTIEAALSSAPSTPGDTVVSLKLGWLSAHSKEQLVKTLLSIRQAASIVKAAMDVHRVGLVTTSDDEVRLIPFHGLSAEWKPTADLDEEYNTSYPGYISSKNGPKSPSATLDEIQRQITGGNIPATDLTYLGDANEDTANSIFAKIIRGELEQWRLWESASHVAFLTPFGNTPGFTVLVPRKPLGSDILAMAEPDLRELATAIWDVSHLLQSSPALGASRVGLIFEGMEIDYAHAKLIPILDKGLGNPEKHAPEVAFTDVYTGSISSKPGPPADLDALQDLQFRLLRAAETRKPIAVTAEPLNTFFEVYQDARTPGVFKLVENWDASVEYMRTVQEKKEYYKEYFKITKPMYKKPLELEIYTRMPGNEWVSVKKDAYPDRE